MKVFKWSIGMILGTALSGLIGSIPIVRGIVSEADTAKFYNIVGLAAALSMIVFGVELFMAMRKKSRNK